MVWACFLPLPRFEQKMREVALQHQEELRREQVALKGKQQWSVST